MKIRKMTAGLALTALALTPGFLTAGPAAAQDQTKEKHANRKGQTVTLDQLPQPVQQTINQESQGRTVGTIKQEARGGKTFYVAEITDQYMTCRYAPFSSGGAMLAYMIAGTPERFFDNVAVALACRMEAPPWTGSRPHRLSVHQRDVPDGKPYPRAFECHHLAMPIRFTP